LAEAIPTDSTWSPTDGSEPCAGASCRRGHRVAGSPAVARL